MKLGGGGLLLRRPRPAVVGLVGGIASGKSTVSRALAAECGLDVIDADRLGHESYQPGTRCFGKLVDAFGAEIVSGDGTIDRRALGQAVRVESCDSRTDRVSRHIRGTSDAFCHSLAVYCLTVGLMLGSWIVCDLPNLPRALVGTMKTLLLHLCRHAPACSDASPLAVLRLYNT